MENIDIEGVGTPDLIDYFKIIAAYRGILKELEKRFSMIEVIRYLIENPDLIALPSNELFNAIQNYVQKLGYNILNHYVNEEVFISLFKLTMGLKNFLFR